MAQKKKKRKKSKRGNGLLVLGKLVLYVLLGAAVLGCFSWGMEKLDEKRKADKKPSNTTQALSPTPTAKSDKVTPKATKAPTGTDGPAKPTDPPKPTDTPAPTATPEPTSEPEPTDTPTPTEAPQLLKMEEAQAFLMTVSADELGLPKSLTEYMMETDDWDTNVQGHNCWCVNVIEKDGSGLVGIYYIAMDRSAVFRQMEENVWKEIKP